MTGSAKGHDSAKLLHDWDSKFTHEFDDILQAGGIEAKKVGPCKPNQNAFAERWVQSIQTECLDRFVVFGEDHLRHIVSQYVEHWEFHLPKSAALRRRPVPSPATHGWAGC